MAGFFSYINDVQEQDIEFLSSDADYYQHVHYTNQPGSSGGVVDPAAAKVRMLLPTVSPQYDEIHRIL
jgi:hypothetical protein